MKVEFDANFSPLLLPEKKDKGKVSGFEKVLQDFLKSVNDQQLEAREVEKALSEGRISNIEEAMFKIERADLSLRLLVEIRNKALESYQEIMRMQV